MFFYFYRNQTRFGSAWLGEAGSGKARLGRAWLGWAWLGAVWGPMVHNFNFVIERI